MEKQHFFHISCPFAFRWFVKDQYSVWQIVFISLATGLTNKHALTNWCTHDSWCKYICSSKDCHCTQYIHNHLIDYRADISVWFGLAWYYKCIKQFIVFLCNWCCLVFTFILLWIVVQNVWIGSLIFETNVMFVWTIFLVYISVCKVSLLTLKTQLVLKSPTKMLYYYYYHERRLIKHLSRLGTSLSAAVRWTSEFLIAAHGANQLCTNQIANIQTAPGRVGTVRGKHSTLIRNWLCEHIQVSGMTLL